MTKLAKIFMVVLLLASCGKKEEAADYNMVINTDKGEVRYLVENAVTHEELEKGLMDRDTLAPNGGMIFDLSSVGPVAMWMKDTKIPLDMLFMDETGKVVWIYENAVPFSEEQIIPPMPVFAVVEINAGEVQKNGIKVGDMVKHSFFPEEGAVPAAPEEVIVIDETEDEAPAPAPEMPATEQPTPEAPAAE